MTTKIDVAEVPVDAVYLRRLLDILPTPVLVVDDDLQVVDHNAAARALLAVPSEPGTLPRGGHILQCVNAVRHPGGCGRTAHCPQCGLRGALNAAVQGQRQVHGRAALRVVRLGREEERTFNVTVTPFAVDGGTRWLVALEDRTALTALEKLFPICPSCRGLRDEPALYAEAEAYLRQYWDADPSAGLCAECKARLVG